MVVDDNKEIRDYLYQAIKTGKPVPTKGKDKAYILKKLDNVRLYVGYVFKVKMEKKFILPLGIMMG